MDKDIIKKDVEFLREFNKEIVQVMELLKLLEEEQINKQKNNRKD